MLNSIVIILPLWMLHGLKISKTRKIGLAALFSIAMMDIAFDVVRTIFTLLLFRHSNAAGAEVWDVLEVVVAVLSSLPTYRSFPGLIKQKKNEGLAEDICTMSDLKIICRNDEFELLESRLSST